MNNPWRARNGRQRSALLATGFLLSLVLAAPAPSQIPTPPADAEYVASSQGRVYYWVGCRHAWGRLKPANILFFNTADEAEEAGYQPSRQDGCGRQEDQPPAGPGPTTSCVVQEITDGDTLVCERDTRVRLLLIDAPEMDQGVFGDSAKAALQRLAPIGSQVRLELDVQVRDRYGRLLAYVYGEDGTFLNERLVRRGYAVVSVYPPNIRHVEQVRAAAEDARRDSVGLWREGAFECLPIDHRRGRCMP